MSLRRFVYYSAALAGWAALGAWLIVERPLAYLGSLGNTVWAIDFWAILAAALATGVLGAAVGAAVNWVAGAANTAWRRQLARLLAGLLGGAAGGLLGGLLGATLHTYLGLPRVVGWTVMGTAIGGAEGLHRRSARRVRNGLAGGALGGLLGGLLFDLIARPGADMASRALGFTVVGVSVGALIGLAHVVMKRAWLTVEDGFRPGRQWILDQPVTILGRGDHLPMPLLGYTSRDLEAEHVRIVRRPDGVFQAEDLGSRIGTLVNGQKITAAVPLADGDRIRLGGNIIRFNERDRGTAENVAAEDHAGRLSPGPQPAQPGGKQGAPPAAAAGAPDKTLPGGAVAPKAIPPGSAPGPSPGGARIPPPPPPPR